MNVTLIIILVGLILMGLWGWASGFIKMVCVLCSSIICFVLTLLLMPITTDILMKSESVYGFFHEKVSDIDIPTVNLQQSLAQLDTIELPEGTPESAMIDSLRNLIGDMELPDVDPGEYLRDKLTLMMIKVLAFFITSAVVSLLVGFAFRIFNVISKLPVVNVANKALGVVSGVVVWGFLILVFMAIVDYLTPSLCEGVIEDINSSSILGWIHDHNFVSPFVHSFLKD